MLNRANAWLANNPEVHLISIESVDRKCDPWNGVSRDLSIEYDFRNEMKIIRILRYGMTMEWVLSNTYGMTTPVAL